MEIEKSKDIRIKLTWFAFGALVFLTALCYFLGWDFAIKEFLIFIAIILGELILFWLICFLLIRFNKKKYKIDVDNIKLFNNSREEFAIQSQDIIQIRYIRFFWILLLQFGSGYLNVTYKNASEDRNFSTIMPNGEKIHSISMSLKQAKEASKILNLKLQVK